MEQKQKRELSEEDAKLRAFLIDILQEHVTLKNYIYEGKDVPAYRMVQKISDKIASRIKDL